MGVGGLEGRKGQKNEEDRIKVKSWQICANYLLYFNYKSVCIKRTCRLPAFKSSPLFNLHP